MNNTELTDKLDIILGCLIGSHVGRATPEHQLENLITELKAKDNEVLGDVSYYYLIDGDTTATGDEYYDYDDGGVWKKLTDADEPHEFESEFHYRTRRKA